MSVSAKFREQLNALMKTLDKTRPTFVRCIKPNTQQALKKKDFFLKKKFFLLHQAQHPPGFSEATTTN